MESFDFICAMLQSAPVSYTHLGAGILPGQTGGFIGKARADADLGLAVVMHPHLVAGSQLGKVPGRGLSLIHLSTKTIGLCFC